MKSDHRHELKTNELADWLAHFPEWATENRNSILAVAAVIVLALGVYFWKYYRSNVVDVRDQVHLTTLVTQVPAQINSIGSAAMQNEDQSYTLLPIADDLEVFAKSTSKKDMAALALIERGKALRAELHYRLAEVSQSERSDQIARARTSYQAALDRDPSPALAATAHYGLGLCEEELGGFDAAAAIYREVADKPEYAGTAARAAAAYRLQIMDDFRTEVVFKPAPLPPAAAVPAPVVQINPVDVNAAPVTPVPEEVIIGPMLPEPALDANESAPPVEPVDATDGNTP